MTVEAAWNAGLQTGTHGAPHRENWRAAHVVTPTILIGVSSRYARGRGGDSRSPDLDSNGRRESLSKAAVAASDKDEYGAGTVGGFEGGETGVGEPVAAVSGSPKMAARRTGSAARGRRSWRGCRGRDWGVAGPPAGQGALAGDPSGRAQCTQPVSPQSGQSLDRVLISLSVGSIGRIRASRSVLAESVGDRQG